MRISYCPVAGTVWVNPVSEPGNNLLPEVFLALEILLEILLTLSEVIETVSIFPGTFVVSLTVQWFPRKISKKIPGSKMLR